MLKYTLHIFRWFVSKYVISLTLIVIEIYKKITLRYVSYIEINKQKLNQINCSITKFQNVSKIFARHVHNVLSKSDILLTSTLWSYLLSNWMVDLLSSMQIAGYPPIPLLLTSLCPFCTSFGSFWSFRSNSFTLICDNAFSASCYRYLSFTSFISVSATKYIV